MREPIEGDYRVIGEPPRREPIIFWPAFFRFFGGIAAMLAIGWVLRRGVELLGYG